MSFNKYVYLVLFAPVYILATHCNAVSSNLCNYTLKVSDLKKDSVNYDKIDKEERSLQRIEKKQQLMAHHEVIEIGLRLIRKNKIDSLSVARVLAESYLKISQPAEAAKWYNVLIQNDSTPEDLFNYAQAELSNQNYKKADELMKQFYQLKQSDSRAIAYQKNAKDRELKQANSKDVQMTRTEFSTDFSDFGVSWFGDQIIYASAKDEGLRIKNKYKWTDEPFLDMYVHNLNEENPIEQKLSGEVNSKYHEANCTLSPDGEMLYFTRNNSAKGKRQKNAENLIDLKIYIAKKSGNDWGKIKEFEHNGDYSTGHPTLSRDGQVIYFTSDMPGGIGGTDIYKSKLLEDGSWSSPENLGAPINTEGNEMFPFIAYDGILYFASNGQWGLGGLDIFKAEMYQETMLVENLGAPFNSEKDDFSFIINTDNTEGYISSNRNLNTGDDIYHFSQVPDYSKTIEGMVMNKETLEPISDTRLILYNELDQKITEKVTSTDGKFTFDISDLNHDPYIKAIKTNGFWTEFTSDQIFCMKGKKVELEPILLEDLSFYVEGQFADKLSGKPIKGMEVFLTNKYTGLTHSNTSDLHGNIQLNMQPETGYNILAHKEGWFDIKSDVITGKSIGEMDLSELMETEFYELKINKTIRIDNINYDYNSADIRKDAAVELDKIVKLLKDNSSVVIEFGSHTDSRGSDSYNLDLSERRAKSAQEYLISKGIPKSRLAFKGYGETQLINHCKNSQECSDIEHEENRRTEFKVLRIEDNEN